MFTQLIDRISTQNVTPKLAWVYARKLMHQLLISRPKRHSILAILGCQRSGTSVMSRVFFHDMDCTVFREKSVLTGGDEGLRYRPFEEVNKCIAKQRAPLVVFKMLVESQRALRFLDSIPGARVVWLFRNYRDVVSSNLTKFGIRNGIDDLRPFICANTGDWRSEACSDATRKIIGNYFSESMNPYDAAALFWFGRNQLFFEQDLHKNNRVMLLEYEKFVHNPANMMQRIYEFCDRPYPENSLIDEVGTGSVFKGKDVDLSPKVDELCSAMLVRLQQTTNARRNNALNHKSS